MKEYTFLAKNKKNETVRDEIYATSEEHAVKILHAKNYTVIKVSLVKEKSLFYKFFEPVKQDMLILVVRQLSAMINAGIPITRTLEALAQDQGQPYRFTKALQKIAGDVTSGYSLSQAMMLFPEFFPTFMIGSIKIGEVCGKLPDTLQNCANHMEKEYVYNLKLKQALIYPTVLLICLGLLLGFCFAYMIPMFLELFSDVHISLPWPTRMLLEVSNFVQIYGSMIFWTLIGPVICTIWMINRYLRTRAGKWQYERLLLAIPWYGSQIRLRMQSQYFRSLSTLMNSAVPLMSSLKVLSQSLEHEMLRATANSQMIAIREGGTFSQGLQRAGLFQPMAIELIKVGEEVGEPGPIMQRLADYLDEEMSQGLLLISKLIEPVVLVILGVGVTFILLAAFLPIYTLAQSF